MALCLYTVLRRLNKKSWLLKKQTQISLGWLVYSRSSFIPHSRRLKSISSSSLQEASHPADIPEWTSGTDLRPTSTTSERDLLFCGAARGSIRDGDQLRFSLFLTLHPPTFSVRETETLLGSAASRSLFILARTVDMRMIVSIRLVLFYVFVCTCSPCISCCSHGEA